MNPTSEIEYWFRKEQEQKKLRAERNRKQMEMLDATTRTKTVSSTIPDMRDAYQQVRDFDYQPTQQEIEFRRFVTGCGYNATKGSK